jgi:hypothetical protein
MHRLEVGDQVGAVEDAVTEIARQQGQPSPTQQPAQVAHRILAMHSGPIGERRSGEHDRADFFRVDRAHHHDLPAGLAIADQARLALGVRMALDDLLDKAGLRLTHILDRLTGYRLRQKADKIARVAGGERDPDLAVVLHAANAGAVPGARVKNDEWPLARVDCNTLWRDDPNQPIIDRSRQ